MSSTAYIFLLLITIGVCFIFTYLGRQPLPPGPKGKFFSSNIHQLPRIEPWQTFAGRSQQFLAWMYHELVGRKLAVFKISSQHPRFPVYRRMLHSNLSSRVVQDYDGPLDDENAGAVILRVAYGWTVIEDDDYFVNLMEHVFRLGAEVTKPSRWLVDLFPIFRYLPTWLPGATFHRHAAVYRTESTKSDTIPHTWAKEQIEANHYHESFTSQHIKPADGHEASSEEDDIIKWCSAALYAGGADTTVAALLSFVLLTASCPEVQARAQTEIDQDVGKDRLPTSRDEARLSYISALFRRAIGRDPQLHADPDRFTHNRFIGEAAEPEHDPRKYVFGFVGRICPGLHFAERALFLNISRILALYNIQRAVDEEGREIDIEPVWVGGVTT
ncbi:hypothetical protein PHLGIDRAFT_21897 [Phlebiopsis gigantea 11061_1 CR5-6]|uniref:Cytochrome P450 n=1 Tax=Phlebiopsis gigantea (strain 11061_1 CR5-6) TaxID=745531 RepID=A0A0C3S510_PHLG1|nr:hypothetical protein PHLGIDRAFT_21897 [Phlebiopsis gigantea 11061_1 CR5-6]